MCAVRFSRVNLAYERHGAQYIALGVSLVDAAIDEGKGDASGRGAEQRDRGDIESLVYFANEQGVLTASIRIANEFHGCEKEAARDALIHIRHINQRRLSAYQCFHFIFGQLVDDADTLDLSEKLVLGYGVGLVGGKFLDKLFRRAGVARFAVLVRIAHRLKQLQRSILEVSVRASAQSV